jgi:hypothetical protein
VSRFRLDFTGTHPDLGAGLRLLSTTQSTFSIFVLALGTPLANYSSGRGTLAPSHLSDPRLLPQIILAALSLIAVFGPLFFFSPHLLRVRELMEERYSILAGRHVRAYERKWFRPDLTENPLGAPEFSSQVDMSNDFLLSQELKLIPVRLRDVLMVVVAALLPLAPPLLAEGQFFPLLLKVMKAVS